MTEVFRRPKVLLLGNGINRCFGGQDWCGWIDKLYKENWRCEGDCVEWDNSMPMPFRAILATNDQVPFSMKTSFAVKRVKRGVYIYPPEYGKVENSEHLSMMKRILEMGFDHILTTNFSYELEIAAWGIEGNLVGKIQRNQRHTSFVHKVENKYCLHTYTRVALQNVINHIWHIHG